MCFFIHKDYPSPLVAQEDIECYKYGYVCPESPGVVYSRFLDYPYPLGRLNPHLNLIERSPFGTIMEGYHSYSYLAVMRFTFLCFKDQCTKNRNYLNRNAVAVRLKCIIPKGTTYYSNPDYGEYVSEQIIIQEII